MQVKCKYCGNMINDTLEQCPHCGAPNSGVRRTANDQPITIEGLKQWYSDRGLPPYEVTRFFIGENYKKPRAFGIYKDENTGNFVVYKNKDSGQRAIRYEGTDEAYAVNELLQRLKQEIIQQKNKPGKQQPSIPAKKSGPLGWLFGFIGKIFLLCAGFIGSIALVIIVAGLVITMTEPKTGYYLYEGTTYYRSTLGYDDAYWFAYDARSAEWDAPMTDNQVPEPLEKKSTSKPYFIQEEWSRDLPCSDFSQSLYARDISAGFHPEIGYYSCDGTWYYHLYYRYDNYWYVLDGRWKPIFYSQLPENMQHTSLVGQYFVSEGHTSRIDAPDFTRTIYYQDFHASQDIDKGYYRLGDQIFYHLASDFSEGWYTYDDYEWSSVEYIEMPEELQHPSTIQDFYYTPVWDSSTQFTDFEDTPLYKDDKDNWSDSGSSNSFDWGSNDSWDSGDTDWGSDW